MEALIVVDKLARRLELLQIPYYVGGSVASSSYGTMRSTNDVDIVVALQEQQVDALVAALEADFYVDGDAIRSALIHGSSFNVIYLPTMVKADLFTPHPTAFGDAKWRRRCMITIRSGTTEVPAVVASAEDMILQKLVWYRMTGERSDRQWGDVTGMVKVQGDALDFDYLRQWAESLDLVDLLRAAVKDASAERPI